MPSGKMTWIKSEGSLSGFEGSGTWRIDYDIFGREHRTAYLPDTNEGREILALFFLAFERRLTFAVGFSVTRNQDNLVVWNGIHHKTH